MNKIMILIAGCLLLAACGTQPVTPSAGHLKDELRPAGNIPQPVQQTAPLPPPRATAKAETYSVSVNNVAAQELLFALARDAKVNIDIHPGIEGAITLNALNQTLPQLLTRIARQVDMRYELDGPNLVVMPDTPFLRHYKVDYLNMSRDATSNISIATQIATTGSGVGATSGGSDNNNSTTSVTNKSNNRFWDTLVQNIKDILRETDKVLPDGSSETTTEQAGNQSTTGTGAAAKARRSTSSNNNIATQTNLAGSPNPATLITDNTTVKKVITFREAASVIANPENGLLIVRATSRQHEKVQEFLDLVMASAKRQVLIEATVVEVQLNDQYQSGIDWKRIAFGPGLTFRQNMAGTNLSNVANPLPDPTFQALISAIMGDTNLTTDMKNNLVEQIAPGFATAGGKIPFADTAFTSTSKGMTIGYSNSGSIAAAVKLLNAFGNVKVLSSPKITALNNQTALLKVVDNRVYFTITAETTSNQTSTVTTYTSSLNTVPVGFVMSVIPQIDENDTITLNIRPTISRIIRYVQDPNPSLANLAVPVISLVPEIQVREMESILKIDSGQTAIMGGLMQDYVSKSTDGIPGLSKIPGLGNLFSNRDDLTTKSELVIFLRPIVVKDATLDGDYRAYRNFLPDKKFLHDPLDTTTKHLFEPVKAEAATP